LPNPTPSASVAFVLDDESPALITLERAWEVIGPGRLGLLRDCHEAGWADWQAINATRAGSELSPTARAQIIHDGAVAQAKRMFAEFMWLDLQGLFALDMDELWTRFKKLDGDLVPRSIPTGQAVLFEEQAQMNGGFQRSLWEPVPMLIVGYVLDQFGLSIERHVLLLRRDGEVVWSRDLPSAASGVEPLPLPAGPSTGPAPAEIRSARPEEGDRKEAQ
jgi:hypothetical protein